MADSQFSLLSLEEELTCSICLSTFDCPVTIPCGHNFCQDCLLASWKDSYSCPQCRTLFATKPELKKNTVLSTVVKTFNLKSSKSEASLVVEESKSEKKDVIRCDTCMEAEASQTCLTCMASFCEEHLRPHRENPKFSVHQLSEPVGDLLERICPDHNKLMEFFCSEHGRPICSVCLQQVHKGCTFMSPEEQKHLKESDLREKLGLLDGKIEKTETVLFQMKDMQSKLKDAAANRKTAFGVVYQQMRDMLALEEREAQHEVDRELEIGQTKLRDLMKRFTENTENLKKAREDVNDLLSQSQTVAFLQASFDLPWAVNFDPYPPRITLDSKKVLATQAFAAALKEHLTEVFKQPVEARLQKLKPDEKTEPAPSGSQPESEPPKPLEQEQQPTQSHTPTDPPIQPYFQPVPVPVFSFVDPHAGWSTSPGSHRGPPFRPKTKPPKCHEKNTKKTLSVKKKTICKPVHKAIPNKAGKACNSSESGKKDDKKSDSSHQPPHNKKGDTSHQPPHNKKGDTSHQPPHNKKGDTSQKPPHKQDTKPPNASGGSKPSAKGSDFSKKDNPKGNPPSGKSAKHHPHPKKNK